ncbi:response regulator transcription factor [Staphylococcus pasteuri]
MAERLGVSPNTVKTHVARLLEKLGAKRRGDAVARARELGIVK